MTRGSGSINLVGMATVARVDSRRLMISDLIYRARLQDGSSEYVAAAMRAPQARAQIEGAIRSDTGLTLKVRADDLKEVTIPAAPSGAQESAWRSLAGQLSPAVTTCNRLAHQIDLLTERRQALITAAVTGELDVADSIVEAAS